MQGILILNILTFLAAFLMFQIELIVAKLFLLAYGGSYIVWGGCVVFFQAVLLLGYLYAHRVVQQWGIKRYRFFHPLLVASPFLFFPGRPLHAIHPHSHWPIAIDIFWQLTWTIGLVFFVLSTFSLILQAQLSFSNLKQRVNPYILYGVSNLGSFGALLSYPFLIEPYFDLQQQLSIWRLGYLFLFLLQIVAVVLIPVDTEERVDTTITERVPRRETARWFFLGAGGAIMFLAVTNIVTSEIAPLPLLWILPLSIYLLAFTLNFKAKPWCPPWINQKISVWMTLGIFLYFLILQRTVPFVIFLILLLFELFVVCMFCQTQLYQSKPKNDRLLTYFYIVIATGSFIGSLVINWIMPVISSGLWEYLLGLSLVALGWMLGQPRQRIEPCDLRLLLYVFLFVFLWPVQFNHYNVFGIILFFYVFQRVFAGFQKNPAMLTLGVFSILSLCILTPLEDVWSWQNFIHRERNYYGLYKILEKRDTRFFMHGTTLHGAEYLDENKRDEALSYYHDKTPIGALLNSSLFDFTHMAAIGLGTGTLAVWARENKTMEFFEIDPDVYKLATHYFHFLTDTKGKINVVFGDARISIRQKPEHSYDVIIVDAFSGDSIPIHLLTTDMMNELRRVLTDKGIIVYHVSNRYLELAPVVMRNGLDRGAYICEKTNPEISQDKMASQWVALTWDKELSEKLTAQLEWSAHPKLIPALLKRRPWTDQYSNIVSVIVVHQLLDQIKMFTPFYW